jgi:threonine synthase
MKAVCCVICQQEYPEVGVPYVCPACGGLFDWIEFPSFVRDSIGSVSDGLWRYRHMLGLPVSSSPISLGEGNTPLITDEYQGHSIAYKLEFLNPTGSFKDRGSSVLLSFLKDRRVSLAVEDSSGNAGASFAAYSSRGGVKARIYVPESASGPKRRQIEIYGAELISVPGPRSSAASAAIKDVATGVVYASHAYLPFGITGIATIAYELIDQLTILPGTVIAPVGHGSLLLGIIRGFSALKKAGVIQHIPYFVGVQAKNCAPVWAEYTRTGDAVEEGATLAEGVCVRNPLRGRAILDEFSSLQGTILAIDEHEILPGRDELAKRGFYVEPTSALVWAALKQLSGRVPDPIILILSGSGFKYAH